MNADLSAWPIPRLRNGDIRVLRPDKDGELELVHVIRFRDINAMKRGDAVRFTCIECGGIDYRERKEKVRCTTCQGKRLIQHNKNYRARQHDRNSTHKKNP